MLGRISTDVFLWSSPRRSRSERSSPNDTCADISVSYSSDGPPYNLSPAASFQIHCKLARPCLIICSSYSSASHRICSTARRFIFLDTGTTDSISNSIQFPPLHTQFGQNMPYVTNYKPAYACVYKTTRVVRQHFLNTLYPTSTRVAPKLNQFLPEAFFDILLDPCIS